MPLIGGSGGGGNTDSGGAGGGALLIASSASITVSGSITANGGSQGDQYGGTGGAGGSVRLVAPMIGGSGTITAVGGTGGCIDGYGGENAAGGPGIVRFEAFQQAFTGAVSGNLYRATPFSLSIPPSPTQPSISVTSIGGVAVPPNPTGSFIVPDVSLNSSSPLTVNIQASNIPVGTIATLYFLTENFPDQKISSTPLTATGTAGATGATATVTLNPGYSKGYVVASWAQ